MTNNRKLKIPLRLVLAYLIFTLLLYAIGPFQWITYHPLAFWMLNISFIIAFSLGWHFGMTIKVSDYYFGDRSASNIVSTLKVLITINLIYVILNLFRRFHISTLSFHSLLRSIWGGLTDMGGAYREFQAGVDAVGTNALGGTALTLFNLVWAFFSFNIIIIGIIYYKKLSFYNKIILSLTIVLIVVEYVATGTNIGVFRIVLVFIVLFFIKVANSMDVFSNRINKKNKRRVALLAIISVTVVLLLFDKIMRSRGGILLWESGEYNVGGIYLNRESLLFKYMPKSLYMLMIALSSYLSQGYYGMSLTLRLPWRPGYGVGHSMALYNLLGDSLRVSHENSYQFRANQFGWKEGQQWHTMYSWFANDVTYIGVIFVMLIIGFAFAIAYKDAVQTNNPFAKLFTYYMTLMAFFIPCNNQLFQSTYVLFAFIAATALWLLSRGGKRIVLTIGGKSLW